LLKLRYNKRVKTQEVTWLPTYEYECNLCGFRFDRKQRFDEEPVSLCPKCQGKARRVLHSVPVLFKGSGFYSTDHGRGSRSLSSPAKEPEKKAESKEEVQKEKPKSEGAPTKSV